MGWRCYGRIRGLQLRMISRDEALMNEPRVRRIHGRRISCFGVAGMVVRWVARLDSELALMRIRELYAEGWRTRGGVNGVFGQFGAGNKLLAGYVMNFVDKETETSSDCLSDYRSPCLPMLGWLKTMCTFRGSTTPSVGLEHRNSSGDDVVASDPLELQPFASHLFPLLLKLN